MIKELCTLLVTSVLINNAILNQFLGMCPFMGVSKKRSSALGMGIAVVFVNCLYFSYCFIGSIM